MVRSKEIIATSQMSQEQREKSGIVWYAAVMQIRRAASTNTSYFFHFPLFFPTLCRLISHVLLAHFTLCPLIFTGK